MFNWNYNLTAKGSQKASEKSEEIVITNKSTEFSLKISIKGTDEKIDGILQQIVEKADNLESCSLVLVGKKEALEKQLKEIATVISDAGGQETLDIHFGEKIKA